MTIAQAVAETEEHDVPDLSRSEATESPTLGNHPSSSSSPNSLPNTTRDGIDRHMGDFLTDEDGRSMLAETMVPAQKHEAVPNSLLPAPPSRLSVDTVSSVSTVVTQDGALEVSLRELCLVIDEHPSLQRARILSTSMYVERTRVKPPHRFLVLHLRRNGRNDIWLRLDRRTTGGRNLVRGLGRTPANDVAYLAKELTRLINTTTHQHENQQDFTDSPSTLGDLNQYLRIMWEELTEYLLWPQNCWMFCSILQEHLGSNSAGGFTHGNLQHLGLAPRIRSRIKERIWLEFRALTPSPITAFLRTLSMSNELDDVDNTYLISQVLPHAERLDARGSLDAIHAQQNTVDLVLGLIEMLNEFMTRPVQLRTPAELIRISSQIRLLLLRQLPQDLFANRGLDIVLRKYSDRLFGYGCFFFANVSHHAACDVVAEVIELTRGLYNEHPDQHRDDLATQLHAYGLFLHEIDSHQAACNAAAEAAELSRDLYRDHPDQLAWRLYVFGIYLQKISSHQAACDAMAEAVELTRELHRIAPDQHRVDLASQLHSYALSLHDTGSNQSACDAEAQAVELTRELYRAHPEKHCAEIAARLYSLGFYLNSAGSFQSACDAAVEAVGLTRDLYRDQPDEHRPNLAMRLYSLGLSLQNIGSKQAACDAEAEAVELTRRLYHDHPDQYRDNLALRLYIHCGSCRTRELCRDFSETHRVELAIRLEAWGSLLHSIGSYPDACDAKAEAVELARDLYRGQPDEHRTDLAERLYSYGESLHKSGSYQAACDAKEEAVELTRDLCHDNPEKYRADLAGRLESYGMSLDGLGQSQTACDVKAEAVELTRELYRVHPDRHRAELALRLYSHGISLSNNDSNQAGCDATAEAVELTRHLHRTQPAQYRADFAALLDDYGTFLYITQSFQAACDAKREAVELTRELYREDPVKHRFKLEERLHSYQRSLERVWLLTAARDTPSESPPDV